MSYYADLWWELVKKHYSCQNYSCQACTNHKKCDSLQDLIWLLVDLNIVPFSRD